MSQRVPGSGIPDQFISDLVNIAVDAKRKNPEIRHACDHSIDILKPFSSSNNKVNENPKLKGNFEEAIKSRPEFISPLLMACHSKNPKLIINAIKILGRVVQLRLIPDNKNLVEQIVDALSDASTLGDEVQVKLLQLLPTFAQINARYITGETLSKLLFICSNLQTANKSLLIINTAQATFSQIMDIAFQKVGSEEMPSTTFHEINIDDHIQMEVDDFSFDAYRILDDICSLVEHHRPSFLKPAYISEDYGFEILESLIKNNSELFRKHAELASLLRTKLAPILLRFISSSKDFNLMVKVCRIILVLVTEVFEVMKIESGVILSLLTHILTKESGSPYWKKVMVLEIYVAIFKNITLLEQLFKEFDINADQPSKSLVKECLQACLTIVIENKSLLNTGDLVQPPFNLQIKSEQQQSLPSGLNSSDFKDSVRFIDSIDKHEAPHVVPTYSLFMITQMFTALSSCIQHSTLKLMKIADPVQYLSPEALDQHKSEENDEAKKAYNCIYELIRHTWEIQLQTADIFIHSSLDDDSFTNVLTILENLCYCAGSLTFVEVQHVVFSYLAVCTLKLDGSCGYKSKVLSFGESLVGTISSTLGHAVSNIGNSSHDDKYEPHIKFYPRSINSRHILCFHTLVRLAVSLSKRLNKDWEIILIVLQWMSYYVDGPSGFKKKEFPAVSEYLSNKDLQIVEHSLTELNKSICNLNTETFTILLKSIISLSCKVLDEPHEELFGQLPVDKDGNIQPCVFNKLFYVSKITDVSSISPTKFMILSSDNMDSIRAFFSNIVGNRDYSDETRHLGSRNFNAIIRASAESGFEDSDPKIHERTECEVLDQMSRFMMDLFELPMSNELLVANCEGEIYLQTLETLRNIVDRFGSLIASSWDIVTEMLNFPFSLIKKAENNAPKENALREIIITLLKSTFETMKVILDEYLQCIPKSQIKIIIDSLHNFVNQAFDLNISFNAISYFWIISDFIKEKVDVSPKSPKKTSLISTEAALSSYIVSTPANDFEFYKYLWVYLVLQLTKTMLDRRAQVRNGSIITVFNIIDSFPSEDSLCEILFNLVLSPVILKTRAPSLISMKPQEQNEWMESFVNIINGLSKFLLTYVPISKRNEFADTMKVTISFFIHLVNLDYGWVELNNSIYKSYHDLLNKISEADVPPQNDLLESLYDFWAKIKINYNFGNPSMYQKALLTLVGCFPLSMKLFIPIMNPEKFEKMLMVLNHCIRYPILADSRNDDERCTFLQESILKNLENLIFDKTDESYYAYQSIIIQQLNMILVLPFHTRDLIVKKLGDKGVKIPTFVAASGYSMRILKSQIKDMSDLTFLNDQSIVKVVKSLIEPSKLKRDILIVNDNNEKTYLWMVSYELLTSVIVKFLGMIMDRQDKLSPTTISRLNEFLPNCLQAYECCFIAHDASSKTNDFAYSQYKLLSATLLKFINLYYGTQENYQVSRELAEKFVSITWEFSFFYKHDSLMESFFGSDVSTYTSITELIDILTFEPNWNIYGSTEPIVIHSHIRLLSSCFKDLYKMSNAREYSEISKIAFPFFLVRCAYGLRKYLMQSKQIKRMPLSKILVIEMEYVSEALNGLIQLESNNERNAMFEKILPMVFQLNSHGATEATQKNLAEMSVQFITSTKNG